MGLTSGFFTWLMAVVAVGSLAAIIWAWPRVARQRLHHIAVRLVMVAASQLLVIAAFLVWMNGYFSFYGSWSQLLGTGRPARAEQLLHARTAGRQVVIYGSQPGPAPGRSRPAPLAAPAGGIPRPGPPSGPAEAGKVVQIAISGARTGLNSGPGYVYLPPQYFQPAYRKTRFPVVLALTGYPGVAGGIVHRLALPAVAARLLAAGRIRPTVFVMLSVSPLFPYDTECTDIPAGPQVESFYAQDVTHAIEQAFRVTSSPAGWGVIGYSTGGFCAAKLAMMYPSRFSAAVSMAGYYQAYGGRFVRDLWGGSVAYRRENSPAWRLRHLPAPPVSVLVTSSRIGEQSLPGTLAFLRLIHPPMRGYSLIIPQGGHNFRTWSRELVPSLEWLSRRLAP
jgi:enterochelin esterase-like enzyme